MIYHDIVGYIIFGLTTQKDQQQPIHSPIARDRPLSCDAVRKDVRRIRISSRCWHLRLKTWCFCKCGQHEPKSDRIVSNHLACYLKISKNTIQKHDEHISGTCGRYSTITWVCLSLAVCACCGYWEAFSIRQCGMMVYVHTTSQMDSTCCRDIYINIKHVILQSAHEKYIIFIQQIETMTSLAEWEDFFHALHKKLAISAFRSAITNWGYIKTNQSISYKAEASESDTDCNVTHLATLSMRYHVLSQAAIKTVLMHSLEGKSTQGNQ